MKLPSDRYTTGEKALTRSEYDLLISTVTDLQDELMITLGVATGMRRTDLTSIECDNIDLDNGRLTYWDEKKDQLKTIDLPAKCVTLIKKFYAALPREERKKRKYLFSFKSRQAYNRFNHWLTVAGIPTRPFHAMRATCIKFAHAAGWSDEQIAKLTGDKIATIQEHYRTPSVDEMREITKEKPIV